MNKISRLKKVALMDPTMFENTLDQISDKGRAILKSIEEYKFSIDQTLRVVKNDVALTNIINQKKKNLDHAAQDLYQIVFEIENVDISEAYNEQQEATQPETPEGEKPEEGEEKPGEEKKDDEKEGQEPENEEEKPEEDKKPEPPKQ